MNTTAQARIKATLGKLGIPAKQIDCYGSQIVVTSQSRDTADRWALALGKFATVKGTLESLDDGAENKNTVLRPTTVKVWRTYATI